MKFRELGANEIECRVSTVSAKGCSLLLYKDARADMNLLDEAVGCENWQRNHELINGNLFCNVGIKINGEWVWKQDVGTESFTEKEKGQASDSFKRACFNWGIGRELYTAPFIWVSDCDVSEKNGKWTTYDRFEVKDIDYTDGVITSLTVINSKTKKVVYSFGAKSVPVEKPIAKPVEEVIKSNLTADEEKALLGQCKRANVNPDDLAKKSGVASYKLLTKSQYVGYMKWMDMVVAGNQ